MPFFQKKEHIALFDYEATKVDEIDLTKNDIIKVLKIHNSDWSYVENVTSKKTGLVPNQYIAKIGSLDAERFDHTIIRINVDETIGLTIFSNIFKLLL